MRIIPRESPSTFSTEELTSNSSTLCHLVLVSFGQFRMHLVASGSSSSKWTQVSPAHFLGPPRSSSHKGRLHTRLSVRSSRAPTIAGCCLMLCDGLRFLPGGEHFMKGDMVLMCAAALVAFVVSPA